MVRRVPHTYRRPSESLSTSWARSSKGSAIRSIEPQHNMAIMCSERTSPTGSPVLAVARANACTAAVATSAACLSFSFSRLFAASSSLPLLPALALALAAAAAALAATIAAASRFVAEASKCRIKLSAPLPPSAPLPAAGAPSSPLFFPLLSPLFPPTPSCSIRMARLRGASAPAHSLGSSSAVGRRLRFGFASGADAPSMIACTAQTKALCADTAPAEGGACFVTLTASASTGSSSGGHTLTGQCRAVERWFER
mmetsp:Transcript_82954/g.234320  ORF Transcript_82954/g.234320 Transcript_82954/m.234320 type:complete len:255 (+) Transcript_82954:364-1128(+)